MTIPTKEVLQAKHHITVVPADKILSDEAFNCRTEITYMDVAELANTIDCNGLLCEPVVQPASDVKDRVMPPEFDYRIVCGHRRFKALQVLKWPWIPVVVKHGLTELQARILNISENLDRLDLNLLEEAKAIKALKDAGLPRESAAKQLKKSSSWVQVRYNLLELPEDIQQEAAAGMITQFQVKELYQYKKDLPTLYEKVRLIKLAKDKNETVPRVGKKAKVGVGFVKKARTQSEMIAMMEHMQKTVGNGPWTRVLAWATGNITDDDLHADLTEIAAGMGKKYYTPVPGIL